MDAFVDNDDDGGNCTVVYYLHACKLISHIAHARAYASQQQGNLMLADGVRRFINNTLESLPSSQNTTHYKTIVYN